MKPMDQSRGMTNHLICRELSSKYSASPIALIRDPPFFEKLYKRISEGNISWEILYEVDEPNTTVLISGNRSFRRNNLKNEFSNTLGGLTIPRVWACHLLARIVFGALSK